MRYENVSFFLLGGIFMMAMSTVVDGHWEVIEKKHTLILELCEAHNAVPFSYDRTEVTCGNGLVINYQSKEQGE